MRHARVGELGNSIFPRSIGERGKKKEKDIISQLQAYRGIPKFGGIISHAYHRAHEFLRINFVCTFANGESHLYQNMICGKLCPSELNLIELRRSLNFKVKKETHRMQKLRH